MFIQNALQINEGNTKTLIFWRSIILKHTPKLLDCTYMQCYLLIVLLHKHALHMDDDDDDDDDDLVITKISNDNNMLIYVQIFKNSHHC